MLPDKLYERYYVEDCDACNDGEINRADDDFVECGECKCNLCEDCAECNHCVVCEEKQDKGDFGHEPASCDTCITKCQKCNESVHITCKAEHVANCNPKSRAKRALDAATETISIKKHEIRSTQRRLASLEEELQAAKQSKAEAKEALRNMKVPRSTVNRRAGR